MSHRSIELLIEDLWEAVEKVERYTVGFDHDSFVQDEKTIDSVVRNFEIIGEAANKLPPEFEKIILMFNGKRLSVLDIGSSMIISTSTLK